ncbi:hypothetical protein Nmel_001006 [Mimus melanotis]
MKSQIYMCIELVEEIYGDMQNESITEHLNAGQNGTALAFDALS